MVKKIVVLLIVLMLTSIGIGTEVFYVHSFHAKWLQIVSFYSKKNLVMLGPYNHCDKENINYCRKICIKGELPINQFNSIQIILPSLISKSPWRLIETYENLNNNAVVHFSHKITKTIKLTNFNSTNNRLINLTFQALTLVQDQYEQEFMLPSSEWSINIFWLDLNKVDK